MIKKLIYILILSIILGNVAFAETQNASVEFDTQKYTFKPGDEAKFLKNANKNYNLFEKAQNVPDKVQYLQEAMRYFFLLSQINPKSIDAQLGLARVYDEMQLDRYAKKYFFTAYNFNPKNPKTNLYFGDFYYKRKDYVNAISYYKNAYKNGLSKDYQLNYKQGEIYEKLADLETAKKFYSNAFNINPQNPELINKIRLLDDLNYSQSQYYLFKK